MTYDIDDKINQYSSTIYRVAYAYMAQRQDAEDVMQEVFFRFVRKKPNFSDEEHEKAWFIRVTANCAKTSLSRRGRRKTVSTSVIENATTKSAETEDFSPLYRAVMALPPKQRLCVHLFYFEEYKISEISKVASLGEATVKSNLCRARKTLKENLKGVYSSEYLEEI